MNKALCILTFIVCLVATGEAQEPRKLLSGQPVAGEIAGGQSHTCQITLTSGQFIRVVVEQRGIDLTLTLVTPKDEAAKPAVEVDLNRVDLESLSYEATVSGDYRLTLRALGAVHPDRKLEVSL